MSDHVLPENEQAEESGTSLTRNDRFSMVFVVIVVLGALGLGLLLRQRATSEVWVYTSREAGIQATYPSEWITDEGGDFVVRIRNPSARPFKTQFIVDSVPAGGQTSIRNVLDGITLQRSSDLPAYRVLNVEEGENGGIPVTRMRFAFVEADPNPFTQRLPVVVQGLDILLRDGDRILIVTYMADEESYEANLSSFQRFLDSLQY